MEIDTMNKFLVSVREDDIVILKHIYPRMSKSDALILAAWLVALADDNNEFTKILEAIRNT